MDVSNTVSVVGAIVAVVGVVGGWIAIRREIYKSAQSGLIEQRLTLYPALWSLTGQIESAPDEPSRAALVAQLRGWYWTAGGGMYLTKESREAFQAAETALRTGGAAYQDRLSELRNRLKEDIRGKRRDRSPSSLGDSHLAA